MMRFIAAGEDSPIGAAECVCVIALADASSREKEHACTRTREHHAHIGDESRSDGHLLEMGSVIAPHRRIRERRCVQRDRQRPSQAPRLRVKRWRDHGSPKLRKRMEWHARAFAPQRPISERRCAQEGPSAAVSGAGVPA